MTILAATTLEKIHAVPTQLWLNIGLGVLLLVAAIILVKIAAGMNKVLLGMIIFVIVTTVGFHWIYNRNEPKFLTPFIEPIAQFMPHPDTKAQKQQIPHMP